VLEKCGKVPAAFLGDVDTDDVLGRRAKTASQARTPWYFSSAFP